MCGVGVCISLRCAALDSSSGVKVKLAARLDQDNAEFLICGLSNEDVNGQDLEARSGGTLAARVEPVPIAK